MRLQELRIERKPRGRTAMKRACKDPRSRFDALTFRCPMSGCWLWTGCIGRHEYGVINWQGRGKVTTAHRASWLLHVGPIADGLFVLHRCDNKLCANPAHLFLGTHQNNMDDMRAKDRGTIGGRHPNAILCEADIARILSDPREGATLARELGVHKNTIYGIRSGREWQHVSR